VRDVAAARAEDAYQHSDGRPLLGRKLAGKSQRELRDLGLLVDDGAQSTAAAPPPAERATAEAAP
jgi:hypothetical protein